MLRVDARVLYGDEEATENERPFRSHSSDSHLVLFATLIASQIKAINVEGGPCVGLQGCHWIGKAEGQAAFWTENLVRVCQWAHFGGLVEHGEYQGIVRDRVGLCRD